jgi:pimeloyl-ACP methyl ester carboxylesterase
MAGDRVIGLVGDTEIAFDDIGTGLPLVLIHAFPLNRTMWAPQAGALVGGARCIPIDLRGFGDSAGGEPYSMDQYADDVVGIMDALQIERAVIGGVSMGGYVAFALWRRHAARIRALVLSSTRATADTIEGIERRRRLIDIAETKGSAGIANEMISGLVGASTRDRRPDIYDAVHRMMSQAPVDGVIGALEAMIARPDSRDTCATIDVPTLIVAGDEDTIIPPDEARQLQASIASSRLEVLPQAGHLPNVERPAAFNTVVSEFLSTLLYN